MDHDNEDVDYELMIVKSVILLLVKTTQSWLPKRLVKIILMVMITFLTNNTIYDEPGVQGVLV